MTDRTDLDWEVDLDVDIDDEPVAEPTEAAALGGPPVADEPVVYAHGLLYVSVCSATGPEDAEHMANARCPTGLDHGWHLADEPFRTGEPQGHTCDQDSKRRHWLFTC